MIKKNTETTYTSSTSNSNSLVLDTKAIITGVVTTLVLGSILGAFGYSRVTESNTFRITTTADALEELKQTAITREVYEANQEVIEYKLDTISQQIKEIREAVK